MPYTYYPYYTPQYQQPSQPTQYLRPTMLQGKMVDSLEVIKAVDIPLDGSVSYFPMVDGSAIASKQLQQDGTSKITIYRPAEQEKETKYLTQNDIKDFLGDFNPKDIKDIKEEIKSLKKQIRNISDDIEEKRGEQE